MRRLVETLLLRDLKKAFRRVCWVGPAPQLPKRTPVILYANHHNFYDGHLLWLLTKRLLDRPATLWMVDWDQFPLFAPLGVQPFPPDDPQRRSATIRRTARRFEKSPETVLVYFPEGHLHAPENGLLDFFENATERMGRLFPEAHWWPVALHTTWWGEARPTALLTGGSPQPTAGGSEHERLANLWDTLRTTTPTTSYRTIFDGRPSASERWNFSFLAPLFKRYL